MLNTSVQKIFLENVNTFTERGRIQALTENETQGLNNTMIANLYKSAVDKAHVDFDTIPDSAGDITKYTGYPTMMESLKTVKELLTRQNAGKNSEPAQDVSVVETAINNIITFRSTFEKGFALSKDFIIMEYNTLVLACVEATSQIIASYIDFVKRPDRADFTLLKGQDRNGTIVINNLDRFNKSVRQGDFSKANNTIIHQGQEAFIGIEAAVVPIVAVGAIMVIVPLIRELIFMFYYSRMRTSDYLKQQATLLELNKLSVQNNGSLSSKEKAEIIKKQNELIKKFHQKSDAIKVAQVNGEKITRESIKKENKSWTLDTVQTQTASDNSGGFQLI